MKKILWVGIIACIVLLNACSIGTTEVDPTSTDQLKKNQELVQKYITDNKLSMQQDASGFYYSVDASNTSTKAAVLGNVVSIKYIISTISGTVLDSSRIKQNIPQSYIYGVTTSLFNYAVNLMKQGNKGLFLFPQYSSSSGEPIKLELTLEAVRTETEYIDYFQATKYPTSNFTTTSTGVRYVVTTANAAGTSITTGKSVTVKYTGRLLFESKKIDNLGVLYYDSKFDEGNVVFTTGASQMIPGFEEGVSKLKEGEKGVILIPAAYAYGSKGVSNGTGGYNIPPYASVLFEVEVTSVK